MYKILIITTSNCEACHIAEHNVKTAIDASDKDIELEVKDWKDCPKYLIKKFNLSDFPSVIYFVDNTVVNKKIGTYPSIVYLRWIDMYFKN